MLAHRSGGRAVGYTRVVSAVAARILVVEDDPEFAGFLAAILRLDGHVVESAADAAAARQVLSSWGSVDLVVLDVWLPGTNGLDICREVKGRRRPPPVLVVTAVPGIDGEAVRAGADLVLRKPVDAPRVRSAVRALLGPHRP